MIIPLSDTTPAPNLFFKFEKDLPHEDNANGIQMTGDVGSTTTTTQSDLGHPDIYCKLKIERL